jgi:sugar phosphate isomerase/epimerase
VADLARLSLNQITTQPWSLREAVEGCAGAGVGWIGVWRDKVQATGTAEAARLLRSAGLRASSLCRGGFFPAPTVTERRARIDDNRRAIDEAAEVGADVLVLVAGPPPDRDLEAARRMVEDGIAELLPYADERRVRLAIEPLHPMYAADRACVNTLRQALDLCDALGDGVGVAIDTYHVWWDPELEAQIARAGERILAHHICDWLVPTRDLLLDRGMMGDGVIDFQRIRRWITAAGYRGTQEVEIFSAADWWKRPGDEVVRVCIERYNSVC